jgi:hypothetical protein
MRNVTKVIVLVTGIGLAAQARANPCSKDAAQFCHDVAKGDGRVLACLLSHKAELKPGCVNYIDAMREKARVMDAACQADAATYCKSVKPVNGDLHRCLSANSTTLSAPCAAALKGVKPPS